MRYGRHRVGILGGGRSGIGAALLAQKVGYAAFVSEYGSLTDAHRQTLAQAHIPFEEGLHSLDALLDVDWVIKSPGISPETPIVQALRKHRIPIISEIEFAARHTNAYLIAITGTNGKTTTASLTHHLMAAAGLDVKLAGNIGKSFAESLWEGDADYFVLEVSSFQLEDIEQFHPRISVVLNVTPDHLDRYHESMYAYTTAKLRITENQNHNDIFIYNSKDYWTSQNLQNLTGNPQMIGLDLQNPQCKPAYWNPSDQKLHVRKDTFDLTTWQIRGGHNYFNATVAILIAQQLGINRTLIADALTSFGGQPHRLAFVRAIAGVQFYNDSKATNVDATLQALKSFREPVIWIAGGIDKGNDYRLLEHAVRKHVRAIVVLGAIKDKLRDFFTPIVPITYAEDMPTAVAAAHRLAQPEGVVLLSPACASFDLFDNYAHRGKTFENIVQHL
ncbi:MAG: UDP-N-acetylmuramoyl-L-alanine--D-glutamate ligase [Bernardetiaceae bacterium]